LLKQLGQELKSHDWNYQYSDDSRYYKRGSQEWESIRNIILQINKMGLQTDGETIWKQFAPSDQKNNYPEKIKENKMKISEFRKLIREEVRKIINEAGGLNSTNKNEFVQLLLKMYLKLDSGTKLDATDYKSIEKFGKAIQNDSDELRNIYASFTDADNKPVDIQKKSLESLIKTVAPNILLADTIRNLSKKSKGSSLSSANKRELKTAVTVIATSAAQGNDMTDNIIDELGDFYNAVYKTNDDKLINAYDELRATADGNAKLQAKAATALLAMLK
jgi:hypothetical protein